MKKIILLLVWMLYLQLAIAQPLVHDANWELIFSDEFGGNSVDATKWDYHPPWSKCHGNPIYVQSCLTNTPNNRLVSNGLLKLIAKKENCTCQDWDGTTHNNPVTNGALYAKDPIQFGYFEIRFKIPHTGNNEGYGPNFWLWPTHPNAYDNTPVEYSELDFFEIDATTNKVTYNMHYKENNSPSWTLRDPALGNDTAYDFDLDASQFHTYACEWTEEYVNFYLDGQLLRSVATPYAGELLPMNMIVDINAPAWNFSKSIGPTTASSYTYVVDYVRVYQLKKDCGQAVVASNVNFSTFDYKVKKSIELSSSTVPANDQITLRAKDYIILKDNFVVPNGSELVLAPTPCGN